MKISIPVGIGMFIALIGLKNAGLVVFSGGGIGFAAFNVLGGKITYLSTMGALLALVGLIAIGVLSAKNVKGGILWGMLGTAGFYYIFAGLSCAWHDSDCLNIFKSITFDSPLHCVRRLG